MRVMVLGLALLMAGCAAKSDRSISVMLETDLQKGTVTLTCRESSSGTCYALFAFNDDVKRLEVPKGSTATATGIIDYTRYCVGATAPGDGCELKPLVDGQQIIRSQSSHR